jgi:hypothetical protein
LPLPYVERTTLEVRESPDFGGESELSPQKRT